MKANRPFSLVRRIIALTVGVSIVAFVLQSVMLVGFLRPLGDVLALRISSQVEMVRAALEAVPPDQRDRIAATLSNQGLSISRTRPVPVTTAFDFMAKFPPPLLDKLSESFGAGAVPFISDGRDGVSSLVIGMQLGPGTSAPGAAAETWWLGFPALRPSLIWPLMPILSSVVLIALAAVLALVIGVRLFTRPMSQLAKDMLERRYQLRPIEEPPRVSVELQGVIRSFNSLVHAVELSAQSRSNLLAGISHDLRTPLARLRLRAETECPEDVAQRMEPDLLALGRIIDQFLAYAQGQNGVPIGEMHRIADLAEAVVGQYRGDGVDIILLAAQDRHLKVPDIGTQRVLVNLIDNARAHGKAPVEVELWHKDSEVFLVVYDHGPGIAEQDLEHAMQPFVRLGETAGKTGHCGLGLAIVAQVAGQLGGRTVHRPFDGRRSGVGVVLPA